MSGGPCNKPASGEAVCWCCDKTEAEAKAHVAAGGQGCAAACHEDDVKATTMTVRTRNAIRANAYFDGRTRPTADDADAARAHHAQARRERDEINRLRGRE